MIFNGALRSPNGLSKYTRSPLYDHHQNTQTALFMILSVFRQSSCGLSKCLDGHQD